MVVVGQLWQVSTLDTCKVYREGVAYARTLGTELW